MNTKTGNRATGQVKRFIFFCLLVSLPFIATAAGKDFTLVIDAGHGGHDAGAVGALTKEKNINLNVALAFGRLVEQNCPDVRVIYTRKTDVFVPLHTRADIANRNKADLFISIHTNALPKGHTARGMETYTLGMHRASDNLDVAKRENSVILIEKDYKQRYEGFDPRSSESYIMFEFMQDKNMAQSVELAKLIQKRTCSIASRPNKGVKQAGFLVLRETSMPSCLIELGFITTSDEERFLHSQDGVAMMARGIYLAFVDYKQKYSRGSKPVKTETDKPVRKAEQPADQAVAATVATPDTTTASEAAQPAASETAQPATACEPVPLMTQVEQEPVFKVQILANPTKLKSKDRRLKGHTDFDYYQDGRLYKYTIGSSNDYNSVCQLRKTLLDQFPECFVMAFSNGKRVNLQEAVQTFKKNNKKKHNK